LNRYFVYCRKSSEEKHRQILSIPSQIAELQRYAQKEKLQIVAVVEESRSAKIPGRPVFNEMLRRIVRGEANGILAWHPDRLARNAIDGGQIVHSLDSGTLTDLRFPTFTFENTPHGKYTLLIAFANSKYYVDKLSEDVRRGNQTKREETGWYPAYAPIGYLNGRNEINEKIIIPDPERFPLIKRIWQLFLTGAYSVPQLQKIARDGLTLRTRRHKKIGGKPFGRTGIYLILKRPFYTGHIVYKGKWYPGKHAPMVTLDEFERAQELIRKDTRTHPKRHLFAYAGLLKCGTCNGGIAVGEHHNRYGYRYVYYHCPHKSQRALNCKERSLEEKELERQILDFLDKIYLAPDQVKEALEIANKEMEKQTSLEIKASIEKALEICRKSIDNLTQLRCQDLIGDEEFVRQRTAFLKEQETLRERLKQLQTSDWIEPSRRLFLFSNRAKFWLLHGTNEEKRVILSTIGLNLFLRDKKLIIDAKKPFRILSERAPSSPLCTGVNGVGTFFATEHDVFIPLLRDPKEFEEKKAQSEALTYEAVKEKSSWDGPTVPY
jgi:site-specific DNA recombinase